MVDQVVLLLRQYIILDPTWRSIERSSNYDMSKNLIYE